MQLSVQSSTPVLSSSMDSSYFATSAKSVATSAKSIDSWLCPLVYNNVTEIWLACSTNGYMSCKKKWSLLRINLELYLVHVTNSVTCTQTSNSTVCITDMQFLSRSTTWEEGSQKEKIKRLPSPRRWPSLSSPLKVLWEEDCSCAACSCKCTG